MGKIDFLCWRNTGGNFLTGGTIWSVTVFDGDSFGAGTTRIKEKFILVYK